MAQHSDVIERTSIIAYAMVKELHDVLTDARVRDEVSLGIIMGLSMFLDETIGPMRSQRLMAQAPGIILKTDAHVTDEMVSRMAPVLRAFGRHLGDYSVPASAPCPLP